ncbi:lytic transglycosylase domain-containing protein [Chelativorans salis]|uniref:Lytic transglycosylase domain-containing protein n=1 Tax=Chelativorans salis TaxID=2978478 RepID=A0ABT2LUN3_9HYPH|nr:lytic transglycosylase domain-containing protein [Chelativorans sp. EGI FJ00035]MCT7378240.1 lytic transglycosylase domain-containing protein [Chelativorans sp. EGI FJ00035]
MDRLTLLMLGVIAVAPCAYTAPAIAEPVAISVDQRLARWQEFVFQASRRFDVPEAWIYAVMDAESSGETMLDGSPITSDAGAMGLMQVMPDTYREMRNQHGLGADPHHPRDNILAGTAYLRAMHDRFGFPGLFAAYHAGPGRYEEHLRDGRPLPKATVSYLKELREAGLSAADMGEFPEESSPVKAPDVPSGRSLFFFRDGVPARGPSSGMLVPLRSPQSGLIVKEEPRTR